MDPLIRNPVCETQRSFNELCELGGGPGGGPARRRVQELLHQSGERLNELGHSEISESLDAFRNANPWHVCFAVGLCWGHLAQYDLVFVEAAVRLLEEWNSSDLRTARGFHFERGPDPIEQSLSGGHMLFRNVRLPDELPDSLERYQRAQERWLGRVISPDRPRYIGSWNASAMFMVALFSDPGLADNLTTPIVMLPPGGPIFNGLQLLSQANLLSRPPSGSELDDEAYEPGAIYENNDLFAEFLRGHTGWNLLTVHSGLYMLGTRYQGIDALLDAL